MVEMATPHNKGVIDRFTLVFQETLSLLLCHPFVNSCSSLRNKLRSSSDVASMAVIIGSVFHAARINGQM